jgi:hypothetical protein
MIRFAPAICLVLPFTASASEDAGLGGASAATAAMGAVLGQAVLVWEAVEARDPSVARSCVEVSAHKTSKSMTFDFDGCEEYGLTGTVLLQSAQRGLVATFGEDFTSHGHGIVGTFTARPEARDSLHVTTTDAQGAQTELVVTDLTEDHVTVLEDLALHVSPAKGRIEMHGVSHLLHLSSEIALEGQLDLGLDGAAPLTWSLPATQSAPQAGVMALTTEIAATFRVGIDPQGPSGPLVIPVDALVAGTFWVEFAETCEETTASFTTEQDVVVDVGFQMGRQSVVYQVVIPAEEVEQTVNDALALRMECPAS